MLRTLLSLQRGAGSRRLGLKRSAAPSWERSGVLSFGPVTVRRQTSLRAAFRQPKAASPLCRIKPLERSHPARNDPFVSDGRLRKRPLRMLMLATCFKALKFCIPTKSTIVPHGPDWLHEVKDDVYRLRVE